MASGAIEGHNRIRGTSTLLPFRDAIAKSRAAALSVIARRNDEAIYFRNRNDSGTGSSLCKCSIALPQVERIATSLADSLLATTEGRMSCEGCCRFLNKCPPNGVWREYTGACKEFAH